jgi:hypothetical protein
MGSAFHAGVEMLGRGEPIAEACWHVGHAYDDMPESFDAYEWAIERETVLRFVCAYEWRWSTMKLESIQTEHAFRLPLINPATGKSTPSFDLAGKIDGIVRLEDGRLAVKETKFLSDDVGPDSDLWRRLRMDAQISLYIHAARKIGYDVSTVLYDVARKPSISPCPVPLVDESGTKIVLDQSGERVKTKDGKKWRQTGDAELGYVLQTRPMTVEEWGEKLTADIIERPDFYFARVEVPRLDQDVAEFQSELWDVQLAIREAQKTGRHYRTVSKQCVYCPYFAICSENQVVRADNPPIGFVVLSNRHPELGEENHVNLSAPATGDRPEAAATTGTETPAAV